MQKRWLVVAVILSYLVMLFGGAALKPDYSHINQFISELNATGTPYAWTVGWLGFVPFGILAGTLLIALADKVPVQGISRTGYWLFMAVPIAYIGSALAPCDLGCPVEGSMSQTIHNALGLLMYLATSLGLLFLSFSPSISVSQRLLWTGLSFLGLVLFALMVNDSMIELRGLLQRLSEWLVYSALCVGAWRLSGADHAFEPAPMRISDRQLPQ